MPKQNKNTELLCAVLADKNAGELQEEYELINRIRECVCTGTVCCLTEADESILCRIAGHTECIPKRRIRQISSGNRNNSLMDVILTIPDQPCVISPVEQNVSILQRILKVNRQHNVLFEYSIITETEECENLYRKIFPGNSRDSFELMLDTLTGAWQTALFFKGRDEA